MNRLFAVPTQGGQACAHFGHCESFAVVEVADGKVVGQKELTPPEHQPGSYPRFLAEAGVQVIIAGGMGGMARNLFQENKIEVHTGVGAEAPQVLVEQYLRDELQTGDNQCSHGDSAEHEHNCGD